MTNQKLKIATWNLDRPEFTTKKKNDLILKVLSEIDADILILTETNSCIDLSRSYTPFSTTCLFQSLSIGGEEYQQGENRVTIWSKLPGRRRIDVCNSHSAICVQLATSWGELNVYGTVIGIYGKNRYRTESDLTPTDFETSLEVQFMDWEKLARIGNLCIAGDFNLSLSDSYYVTKHHRQRMLDLFKRLEISVPTDKLPENIDHIALSRDFSSPFECATGTWRDKIVSDHQGVWLTLDERLKQAME